jgi:hypothetical protein
MSTCAFAWSRDLARSSSTGVDRARRRYSHPPKRSTTLGDAAIAVAVVADQTALRARRAETWSRLRTTRRRVACPNLWTRGAGVDCRTGAAVALTLGVCAIEVANGACSSLIDIRICRRASSLTTDESGHTDVAPPNERAVTKLVDIAIGVCVVAEFANEARNGARTLAGRRARTQRSRGVIIASFGFAVGRSVGSVHGSVRLDRARVDASHACVDFVRGVERSSTSTCDDSEQCESDTHRARLPRLP